MPEEDTTLEKRMKYPTYIEPVWRSIALNHLFRENPSQPVGHPMSRWCKQTF